MVHSCWMRGENVGAQAGSRRVEPCEQSPRVPPLSIDPRVRLTLGTFNQSLTQFIHTMMEADAPGRFCSALTLKEEHGIGVHDWQMKKKKYVCSDA